MDLFVYSGIATNRGATPILAYAFRDDKQYVPDLVLKMSVA